MFDDILNSKSGKAASNVMPRHARTTLSVDIICNTTICEFVVVKKFRSTQNSENFLREYYLPIVLYIVNIWHTHKIDENIVTQKSLT